MTWSDQHRKMILGCVSLGESKIGFMIWITRIMWRQRNDDLKTDYFAMATMGFVAH